MQSFTSVPFKAEMHSGFASVNGIAKFSPAGIVLEFEAKWLGLIGGGVKEVRLPVAELLDVRFRKGIFKHGAKIEVRTTTFSRLKELPNKDGKLTLNIVKDDWHRASDAVAQLQKDLAEYKAEIPPPQTPVSQLFQDESDEETRELPG